MKEIVSVPSRGYFFPISQTHNKWRVLGTCFRPLSGLFFSDNKGKNRIKNDSKRVSVPSRGYFFPIREKVYIRFRLRNGFRPLSGLFFSDNEHKTR